MAFRVFPTNMGSFRAEYAEVLPSGVLRADVEGIVRYFAPGGWISLELTGAEARAAAPRTT